SGKPVLVYFTSQSCPPCKIVAPHVERLSKLYEGLIFVKVDVDAAKEIAAQARIRAMPTFQAYHNAALVGETVGANLNNIKGLVEK
ncbi:thioredoxin-like protein, partial [Ramicandelaber brevisporus]